MINKELLAADYGTPQMRRRIFFIASKNLKYFNFPQPTYCETENLLGLPLYVGAGNTIVNLPDFVRFFGGTFGAGVIASQCPITRPKRHKQPEC